MIDDDPDEMLRSLARSLEFEGRRLPTEITVDRAGPEELVLGWGGRELYVRSPAQNGWEPGEDDMSPIDSLYHPRHVTRVPDYVCGLCEPATHVGFGERWVAACRLVDHAIGMAGRRGDIDARSALPALLRTRFALRALPLRFAPKSDDPLVRLAFPEPYLEMLSGGVAQYLAEFREARATWAHALLGYESHVVPTDSYAEEEIARVLWRDPDSRRVLLRGQLRSDLSPRPERRDDAFISWVGTELAAPRYMLRAMWAMSEPWLRRSVASIAGFVLLLGALGATGFLASLPGPYDLESAVVPSVIGAGVLGLFLIVIGTLRSTRNSYAFFVRLGASTVIGAGALVSLFPQWVGFVRDEPTGILGFVLGVLGVSFLYLSIESRMHGAPTASAALRRGAVVLGVGIVYGVVIGAVALSFIAPVFTEGFAAEELGSLDRNRAMILLASASTTFGVFVQLLWEDKPVTYPLSAVRRAPPTS